MSSWTIFSYLTPPLLCSIISIVIERVVAIHMWRELGNVSQFDGKRQWNCNFVLMNNRPFWSHFPNWYYPMIKCTFFILQILVNLFVIYGIALEERQNIRLCMELEYNQSSTSDCMFWHSSSMQCHSSQKPIKQKQCNKYRWNQKKNIVCKLFDTNLSTNGKICFQMRMAFWCMQERPVTSFVQWCWQIDGHIFGSINKHTEVVLTHSSINMNIFGCITAYMSSNLCSRYPFTIWRIYIGAHLNASKCK